jgi:hypothetical protein
VSLTESSLSNSLTYEEELDLAPCNPAKFAHGVSPKPRRSLWGVSAKRLALVGYL